MDCMFEAYLTHEAGHLEPDDIPLTNDPVWVLGKKYNALQELDMIRRDIQSKLWFTYRKGFVPIGGNGSTSDKGWGCMLRCGQMVLAQALIELHLGRDWFWTPETRDSTYLKIVRKFEDRRQEPYSIHQIALMGASEGKDVGEWFGPNTVAQVLKKLVVYDDWSSIAIHVALDNTIVVNDIKKLCAHCEDGSNQIQKGEWKPLLLLVPLRLGLANINPIYANGLKNCFKYKQSLGVIGGKPNHALYFVGFVGEELICLDPHTTQKAGLVENKETEEQIDIDTSYHCKYASRLPILSIDPSVAVCFFCATEQEFDELCKKIENDLIKPEKQPLFEICSERPRMWVPNEATVSNLGEISFHEILEDFDKHCDNSDDEFEIL